MDLIPNIEHGYPFVHPNWQKFDFVDCHLTKIIRQSGDEELIRNENLARAGDSCCLEWFAQNTAKKMDTKAIHICPTNRMGSARIADRIVVMENGRVAEIGTHDELISKKGTYFDLFMSQAQWYENQNA